MRDDDGAAFFLVLGMLSVSAATGWLLMSIPWGLLVFGVFCLLLGIKE